MLSVLLVVHFYMPGPSRNEGGYTCDACLSSDKSCFVPVDPQGIQPEHGRKEYVGNRPPEVKGPCISFNIFRLHPGAPYD